MLFVRKMHHLTRYLDDHHTTTLFSILCRQLGDKKKIASQPVLAPFASYHTMQQKLSDISTVN